MKKQIFYFICATFFLSCPVVFASGDKWSEWGGKVWTHGSDHPPHSHDNHDHLKHIRGHGSDRKKKSPRS